MLLTKAQCAYLSTSYIDGSYEVSDGGVLHVLRGRVPIPSRPPAWGIETWLVEYNVKMDGVVWDG